MWFLWGFLMFFVCHTVMMIFLIFVRNYRHSASGMDLFAASGVVVFWVGALIFGLTVIGDVAAIIIGNVIGFCSGFIHYKINGYSRQLKKKLNDDFGEFIDDLFKEANTEEKKNKYMAIKLQKIIDYPAEAEVFTYEDIVNNIINLADAQLKLTSYEYEHIYNIFQNFDTKQMKMLNYKQYLTTCNEIISHFDMVAPYYKYCGDLETDNELLQSDEEKQPYRAKAKKLLDDGMLLGDDWNALNAEFKKEFYNESYL